MLGDPNAAVETPQGVRERREDFGGAYGGNEGWDYVDPLHGGKSYPSGNDMGFGITGSEHGLMTRIEGLSSQELKKAIGPVLVPQCKNCGPVIRP